MNLHEAARRLDALIAAHIDQLEDLGMVRKWLSDGDYKGREGKRELTNEVVIGSRRLWKMVKNRAKFEEDLFGEDEGNDEHQPRD